MSRSPTDLQALRERAEQALASGELQPGAIPDEMALERLVEDLRVYQAELEIQNRELGESQGIAQAERKRYQSLFEAFPLPALVIDSMGVITETNHAAVSFFGFRTHSVLRRHSIFRLFADRGGAWFGRALEQAAAVPGPNLTEKVPVLSGAGSEVPMDCLTLKLDNSYHADRHVLILLVDRSLEQARERDRRLYKSLMDNSQALVYAFDLAGRCLLMNRAAGRFFKVDPDDTLGLLRHDLLQPVDAEREARLDRQVLDQGESLTEQLQLRSGPGRELTHMVSRFPLRNEQAEIFAVAVIATDISERLRLQTRLDLAAEIFTRGSEAILITDGDNRITFVNPAFELISGYAERDVLGTNPLVLVSGRHDREFFLEVQRQLKQDGLWEGEVWPRRSSGEVYPSWLRVSRVQSGPNGQMHHVLVLRDITQEKHAEEEIERLAYFDMLTGTPNRYLLKDRVDQAIRAAARSGDELALVFLDLDRFKEINDAFGHDTGDRLLVHFARRLQGYLREEDTICRLGGDEFVLLLKGIDRQNAGRRLEQVLAAATEPFVVQGRSHQVSASIGVAMYPADGENFEDLLKNADTAMYQAKADGRDQFRFFHDDMAVAASSAARIEAELRVALEQNAFRLVYQPQVELASGRVIGAEALLRWDLPDGQSRAPGLFIPIAEKNGLIVPLGNWVLERVIRQIGQWAGSRLGSLPLSINVAAEQFWRAGFVDGVIRRVTEAGVAPGQLSLELTERTAMKLPTVAAGIMQQLNQSGMELSLDDFGTGYSSLAYLKRFPLQFLKIDRSFVAELATDTDDQAICRAIIQVAHTLGMRVIAEGVETLEQEAFLRAAGCDIAQGFLYAPGLRPEALAEWVAERELVTV